jgi:hypothetical protein
MLSEANGLHCVRIIQKEAHHHDIVQAQVLHALSCSDPLIVPVAPEARF